MLPQVQSKFKDKQKIEKNAESVKPTVINDHLIESYMHEYHREQKIFGQEHMRIWDLTHLSLSFKSWWFNRSNRCALFSCRHR